MRASLLHAVAFVSLALMAAPPAVYPQTAYLQQDVQQLIALLRSSDARQRIAAAEALGSLGAGAAPALPALTAALKDPDRNVRGACICSIGAVGEAALPAAQSLRGFLSDPDPSTRLAAAGALGNLGPAAKAYTGELLKVAASDQDADVRAVALQSLGQVRCDPLQAASVLERGMKDKLARVQVAALGTAAALGIRSASTLQAASSLIGNERETVHMAALEAVAQLQDRDPPGGLWPPNVWLPIPASSAPVPDPFAPKPGERVWKPPTYKPPVTSFPVPAPASADPQHRGKTLTEWIRQLSSADAEARWQACQALGEMGWRARLAIPSLAAAREDREVKVRHEAIVALEKIRGRIVPPPAEPKPSRPETPTVAGPAAPTTGMAAGYLYFVHPCQVMTLEGPRERRETVEPKQLEGLRLRIVNVQTLRLKEAALRKEGNADPKAELTRLLAAEDGSLVLDCQEDYLIRATCAGQHRFVNGHDGRAYGVIGSFGLRAGDWHVEVSCVGRAGFRIETGVDVRISPVQGVAEGLQKTRDNVLKYRQVLATSTNDYNRNQAANRLMFALEAHALWLLADGRHPDEVMPVLNESIEASRLAGDDKWYASHLFELVGQCTRIGCPKSYPVALRAMGEAEKLAQKVDWRADMVVEGDTGSGFRFITRAYGDLASIAIGCSDAVPVARQHAAQMLAWEWASMKASGQAKDEARNAWAAGQLDHWPEDWAGDQLDPPELITGDIGKYDWGQVATTGPRPPATTRPPPKEQPEPQPERELPDDDYWDRRWVDSVTDDLAEIRAEAFALKGQLRLQKEAAARVQERIGRLQAMMADPKVDDETWFETFVRRYDQVMEGMGTAQELLRGEYKPRNAAEVKAYLERRITMLRREYNLILREQDATIAKLDGLYADLIKEVETKSPRCQNEQTRKDAVDLLKNLEQSRAYDNCDLYAATGQRGKFKELARAVVGDKQTEAVGRLMQGLEYVDNNELRSALNAFRKCVEVDPGNQRAEGMIRDIEVAYLRLIDTKTMDDAAEVRRVAWDRLSKHGEPGFWGAIADVCTSGVTTSAGALLGRHEDIAVSAGQMQQEAAQQHAGLMIITRLREKGLTFDSMRSLTNEQFITTIEKLFGPKLTPEQAKQTRAAMMFGLRHKDVDQLISGKLQLAVDTGESYFDTKDFKESWAEWGGEMANVKNVATFFGPSAVVSVGGKLAIHSSAYTAAQLKTAVTVKDVTAEMFGLTRLADRMWRSETGREVIGEIMTFERTTGRVSKFLADALLQQALVQGANRLGNQIGYGKEAAAIAEALTVFGIGEVSGTIDVLRRSGVNYQQMQQLVRTVSDGVYRANMAQMLDKRSMTAVNAALSELAEKGSVSPAGLRALDEASATIGDRLQGLAEKIRMGDESVDMLQQLELLKATSGAIEAAKAGAGEPARRWHQIAEDLSDRLNNTGRCARRQQQACQSLQDAMAQAPAPAAPPAMPPLDQELAGKIAFGASSRSKGQDQVFLACHFKQADRQYGEAIETLRELGLDERAPVLREFIYKQQMAREALSAERYLNLYRQTSGSVNAGISVGFKPADVTSLTQATDLKFTPLTKKGTGPYMVERASTAERLVFRPDVPGEEFRNQAEEAVAGLAEFAKRPCPAATRVTLNINGVPTPGVLTRHVQGMTLKEALAQHPGMRSAVKEDIAADWAFSAWAGDYDRHPGNYMVGTKGTPAFDRDLANVGELQYDICHKDLGLPIDGLSADPDRKRDSIIALMEKRLDFCKEHADHPLYGQMVQIEREMTFDDMKDTVDIIEKITPEQILERLKPVYGNDANAVLEVLLIRQKHLREVLSKKYPGLSLPKPQAALPSALPAAA